MRAAGSVKKIPLASLSASSITANNSNKGLATLKRCFFINLIPFLIKVKFETSFSLHYKSFFFFFSFLLTTVPQLRFPLTSSSNMRYGPGPVSTSKRSRNVSNLGHIKIRQGLAPISTGT